MHHIKSRCKKPKHDTVRQYDSLFIYYIKGDCDFDESTLSDEFIGTWREDEACFLFFTKPSLKIVEKILCQQPDAKLSDEFYMSYEQWHGKRVESYCAGRFLISPPWENHQRESGADPTNLPIILDPGVVFGTGTHATTKDCLNALEWICDRHTVDAAIDIGTGTGLLALAASKLCCKKVLAVDLNLLAAKTARRNIELNHMEDQVVVVHGRAEDFIDSPFDLVIANIHYEVMKDLISARGFVDKKWFILSGLLRSQAKDIRFRLSRQPVRILKTWEGDGIWHTFVGEICCI
jgi:ribosomal protein L11 methyltransferase